MHHRLSGIFNYGLSAHRKEKSTLPLCRMASFTFINHSSTVCCVCAADYRRLDKRCRNAKVTYSNIRTSLLFLWFLLLLLKLAQIKLNFTGKLLISRQYICQINTDHVTTAPVRAKPESRPRLDEARYWNTRQACSLLLNLPSPHVANTHRTHLPIPFLSLGKHTGVDWTPARKERTNEQMNEWG